MPKTQRSAAWRDAEAIERIREVLWPTDDPERQWTPDTLDRIAEIVTSHKSAMVNKPERLSDAEIRALYGSRAVISRKGLFTLVHLDNPCPAIVRQRRREFDPGKFFCADCPLCSVLKESGVIVFDDSTFDVEEPSPETEKTPMIAKVSFAIEPDRYKEFCSLLGQFAETLSGDSIIEHSSAYTIEEVSDDSGNH